MHGKIFIDDKICFIEDNIGLCIEDNFKLYIDYVHSYFCKKIFYLLS